MGLPPTPNGSRTPSVETRGTERHSFLCLG